MVSSVAESLAVSVVHGEGRGWDGELSCRVTGCVSLRRRGGWGLEGSLAAESKVGSV